MKKILILIIITAIALLGCNSNKIFVEDFTGENFRYFLNTKNIIYHLDLNKNDVQILAEDDSHLMFSFLDNNFNDGNNLLSTYSSYIKKLEQQGYYTLHNYNVRSDNMLIFETIELTNDKHTLNITAIYNLDKFKQSKKHIKNIDKISNQNMLFEIEKQS